MYTVDRLELKVAVDFVAKAALEVANDYSAKQDILTHIAFMYDGRKLYVKATDGRTTLMAIVSGVTYTDETEHKPFTLPALKFSQLLNNLTEYSEIDILTNQYEDVIVHQILYGDSVQELPGLDATLFPKRKKVDKDAITMRLDEKTTEAFTDALKAVRFSICTNPSYRLPFMGVLLKGNGFMGMDVVSYDTTIMTIGGVFIPDPLENLECVLPRTFVSALLDAVDMEFYTPEVTLHFTPDTVTATLKKSSISSQLIAERYPDYTTILPQGLRMLTVNRKELAASVARCLLTTPSETSSMSLLFDPRSEKLVLRSMDAGHARETTEQIKGEYGVEGGTIEEIFVAGKQLSRVLQNFSNCEKVHIGFKNPTTAIKISTDSVSLESMFMPVVVIPRNVTKKKKNADTTESK